MDHAHVPSPLLSWLVLGLLGVAMVVYLAAASRMLRRGKRWSAWRCICWVVGVALLMIALSPATLQAASREFSGHMLQHLLIGMYAPLALTLAAPMTLTLATLSARARRPLVRALRSPPMRLPMGARRLARPRERRPRAGGAATASETGAAGARVRAE